MKTNRIILCLAALLSLSACGGQFSSNAGNSSPGSGASSASSDVAPSESPSNKVLQDIGVGLRQKSLLASSGLSLTESQIISLLTSGKAALIMNGLGTSANINITIPVIVQGITQALSSKIPGISNSQISSIMSALGTSAIDAAIISSGGTLTAGFVQVIATTLFQNLSAAGISSGNLSPVSGVLMTDLVSYLGKSGFQTGDLSGLLQSLTSGAVLGVGNLNLNSLGSVLLSDILNKIGAGSVQGLSGIGASGSTLQGLINSLTSGSKMGLTQVLGSQSGLSLNLNQLLSSLISGQTGSLGRLPLSSIEQQLISGLLQGIISKI